MLHLICGWIYVIQILQWHMFYRLGRGRIVTANISGTIRDSDMSNEAGFLITLLTIEEGHFSPVLLGELLQHWDLGNFTGNFVRGAPTSWISKRIVTSKMRPSNTHFAVWGRTARRRPRHMQLHAYLAQRIFRVRKQNWSPSEVAREFARSYGHLSR